MENYVKEQAASRRYLDQIETLQKTNLQLIQRHLTGILYLLELFKYSNYKCKLLRFVDFGPYDPEIKKHFQLAQSYDSLFRFTMNLLRKVGKKFYLTFNIFYEFTLSEPTVRFTAFFS